MPRDSTPDLESKRLPAVEGTPNLEVHDRPFDAREWLLPSIGLAICSPICFNLFSYTTCQLLAAFCLLLPSLARLAFPNFLKTDIIEDLRIGGGLTLSFVAAQAAIILQLHHPVIAFAIQHHRGFHTRQLSRWTRTFLYMELALNGSSEEKEQTGSWLRWVHRHIEGSISPEAQKKWTIPAEFNAYGYLDEFKAFVIETLAFATIEFQQKFGRRCVSAMSTSI